MIALLDIGGTKIKYGIIDAETEKYNYLDSLVTRENETDVQSFNILERIKIILDKLFATYDIQGIAISTAGIVDVNTGEIIYANENIPNYSGTRLRKILEDMYKVPVTVENDVNAALLGELEFGDYGKVHSVVMLTIGTGIGGALYLNNSIYHGFNGCAGEVGYSILDNQNIETITSTRALVRNVRQRIPNKGIDGQWIFDQAINHDNAICIEEIDNLINNIMEMVNNIVSLLNPQYVILGGGIMEQKNYLSSRVEKAFKAINRNALTIKSTQLSFASLGNQAGLLGAYVHFKRQREEILNENVTSI